MKRPAQKNLLGVLVLVGVLLFGLTSALAQSDVIPWESWAAVDLRLLDDDNTGSTFAMSAVEGIPALRIAPSGSSEETKLAYPVSGSDLLAWRDHGRIRLDVFLPEAEALQVNAFFLGLGDVTRGWSWVGGVFGEASGDAGWVAVTFILDAALRETDPDGSYMMYLSFFHEGSGGKVPLTEPIYVAGIQLIADSVSAAGDSGAEVRYRQEIDALLTMDDDAFVDAIARQTFDFFWLESNPQTGLVKDRSTPDSVSSIASTGFGLASIPLAIDRGWIDAEAGYARVRATLQTFLSGGVQGERGFFYHFVDMATGERVWNSEVSSIDTALLVAGALVAGSYFADTEVQTLADRLYENVEWDWMLAGGDLIRMGWRPESGFLGAKWDHFDESLLLYVLAIGSPTHPIPAYSWDLWDRPVRFGGEYIYLPGEPLFVYQYPLAFLDLRGLEDAYAHYWNNAVRACERSRQFARDHSDRVQTYQHGVWGISASDGPTGYRAYGASEANHDGTVAPYASTACLPFTPDLALEGMRALLRQFGGRVWREYGFVSAINADAEWYSRDHIGIDQGDILLMIANHQDGFVWEQFMANPPIQTALGVMGFVESVGEYAVTPAYLSAAAVR